MYLQWGNYQHAANSVGFALDYRIIHDEFKRMRGNSQTWQIFGVEVADTKADLTQALVDLETAYNTGGKDLVFYNDDGTPTRHAVYDAQTISGTRVTDFRYTAGNPGIWGMGTEYLNKRSYRITVQAETLENVGVIAWHEKLRAVGDGLYHTKWMESLLDVPVPQIPQNFSTFFVVQSGYAVGDDSIGFPTAPTPLFGRNVMHPEQSWVEYDTPQFMRHGNDGYVTRWKYVFESSVALNSVPTFFNVV